MAADVVVDVVVGGFVLTNKGTNDAAGTTAARWSGARYSLAPQSHNGRSHRHSIPSPSFTAGSKICPRCLRAGVRCAWLSPSSGCSLPTILNRGALSRLFATPCASPSAL
jgi:hypothetical protein